MTTDPTPALNPDQRKIPPWETTRVPGTDLAVWHNGREPQVVTILNDGAVDLPKGPTWIVRVAR